MSAALHEQAHARTDEKLDQIDQKLELIAVEIGSLKLQVGIGRWLAALGVPAIVSLLVTIVLKKVGL
jgi:hypothetical protein